MISRLSKPTHILRHPFIIIIRKIILYLYKSLSNRKPFKHALESNIKPVNDRHFLFSGGGLNSKGGRASKSFNRLDVRPMGWLCPIYITSESQ